MPEIKYGMSCPLCRKDISEYANSVLHSKDAALAKALDAFKKIIIATDIDDVEFRDIATEAIAEIRKIVG